MSCTFLGWTGPKQSVLVSAYGYNRTLEKVIESEAERSTMRTFLSKTEGRMDSWLTFVSEPAVKPMSNTVKNAIREPEVFRKIIGTLRNENQDVCA